MVKTRRQKNKTVIEVEVELLRSQVFFPASLEIQEELLKAGFKVPYDKESGRKTPVPVVVSSREHRKIRESRLLKARDYEGDGKFALLPEERAVIELDVTEKGFLVLKPKPMEYHLEERAFFPCHRGSGERGRAFRSHSQRTRTSLRSSGLSKTKRPWEFSWLQRALEAE